MRGHDWVRRVVLGSSHSPAPEADEAETLSPRGSAGMGAALARRGWQDSKPEV